MKVLIIAGSLLLLGLCCSAKVVRGYASMTSGPLTLTVDSVDYRADLTRLYGKLSGRPHTSQRLDGAAMDGAAATDIDGIDFKRYFQWEDDGVIAVEIDFPAPKQVPAHFTVTLNTVYGPAKAEVAKKRK